MNAAGHGGTRGAADLLVQRTSFVQTATTVICLTRRSEAIQRITSRRLSSSKSWSKCQAAHNLHSTSAGPRFHSCSAAMASNIHVSNHPCLKAKLSQLRSASTGAKATKMLVHDIATIVGCEALAQGLTVESAGTDVSPLGYEYNVDSVIPSQLCLVPILRSGLSMVEALEGLLPVSVPVHHLGMYREKSTLQPVEYYNNLPYHKAGAESHIPDLAIIVDPIIATGQTVCAAIETLRDWGVKKIISISVLASEGGLQRAAEAWPEAVEIWVGGVDADTDDRGMIKPGLGDIGDRLYLTLGK